MLFTVPASMQSSLLSVQDSGAYAASYIHSHSFRISNCIKY